MSYQVLARKWRPRLFTEMVGQEHVLKALINALDNNRLHHAYLFTGTRGVGKTTIARILAKCLNCEQGVSSKPCEQCAACEEINQGRFVDLIEVDAASRTKVEDTRELMDNVQYMPSKGRFKVYLIDEVHMLSGHSFNALLKTLEEPPPHVKFLLATTDPQKLPITILSRCLQFNLKNLSPERIEQHLEDVLQQEHIPFETSALWQLARAADGSMRDALSLTDQAISFGNGQVLEADVSDMLGTIDQHVIVELVKALLADDAQALLTCVDNMAQHIPDYAAALAELIVYLHRIAIAQVVPEAVDNTYGDQREILDIAAKMAAEDVQLFYQCALLGRKDLDYAPDPRSGFEMVLLRMLAFKPQGSGETVTGVSRRGATSASDVSGQMTPPIPADIESNPEPVGEGREKKFDDVTLDGGAATSLPIDEAHSPVEEIQGSSDIIVEAKIVQEEENVVDEKTVVENKIVVEEKTVPEENPAPEENIVDEEKITEQSSLTTDSDPTAEEINDNESKDSNVHPREQSFSSDLQNVEKAGAATSEPAKKKFNLQLLEADDWYELVNQLDVGGVIQNTVLNCQLLSCDENNLSLMLDRSNSTLYDEAHQQRLQDAVRKYFDEPVTVRIQVGEVTAETPAVRIQRLKQERQAMALRAMQKDPLVRQLVDNFGAALCEETVVPLNDR